MEISNEIKEFDVGECEYRVKLANGENFVYNIKGILIITPRFYYRFDDPFSGKYITRKNDYVVQKAEVVAHYRFVKDDTLEIGNVKIKTSNIVSFEPIIRKPLIKKLLITKVVVEEKSLFSKRYVTNIKYEKLEGIKND